MKENENKFKYLRFEYDQKCQKQQKMNITLNKNAEKAQREVNEYQNKWKQSKEKYKKIKL